MRLVGFILLLTVLTPVVSYPWSKSYYTRIVADFYCHNKPFYALGEVIETDNEATISKPIKTFKIDPNNMDNHLAITIHDVVSDPVFWIQKPRYFLRVYHNCGCGSYYDTTLIPSAAVFETEEEANTYPFELLDKIFKKYKIKENELFHADNVVDLLLSRAGIFTGEWDNRKFVRDALSKHVCEKHFRELIRDWNKRYKRKIRGSYQEVCSFPPEIDATLPTDKKLSWYHITATDAAAIQRITGKIVRVGTGICKAHQLKLSALLTTNNNNEDTCSAPEESFPEPEQVFDLDSSDESMDDSVVSDTSEDYDMSRNQALRTFASALGLSRVVPQHPYREACDQTVQRRIVSAKKIFAAIAEVMFPANSKVMERQVCSAISSQETDTTKDMLLRQVADQFRKTEDKRMRLYALSCVIHVISCAEIQQYIPHLTYHYCREAKKLQQAVTIPKPTTKSYQRYDQNKINLFIQFITSSNVIVGLPFGVRTIKNSRNEKLDIPNTMRMQKHAEIIRMYGEWLQENDQIENELPRSVMYDILKHCTASRSKQLTCVDYYIADGMQAFDDLLGIVQFWKDHQYLEKTEADSLHLRLEHARQYLRTDFKLHLKTVSPFGQHCIRLALSDPTDAAYRKRCDDPTVENAHNHISFCERCNAMHDALSAVIETGTYITQEAEKTNEGSETVREHLVRQNKIKLSVDFVLQMEKHLVRSVFAEQQRTKIIENLDETTALITIDWAQKLLPIYYREKQSDYFGQKGMSWHISHVMVNISGVIADHTFVHIIERHKQDSQAVLAILEDVLKNVSRMGIDKVIIRSDNAGCYHSKHTLLAVPLLKGSTNVDIIRWSFSEPQAGKSACDRSAATIKRKLRDYSTSHKINIETSTAFFDVLLHSRIAHTTVALATIIPPASKSKTSSIPKITSLSDFSFGTTNMRVFKFFGIGPGKELQYSKYNPPRSLPHLNIKSYINILEVSPPPTLDSETSAMEASPPPTLDSEMIAIAKNLPTKYFRTAKSKKQATVAKDSRFYCLEESCGMEFSTLADLEEHMDFGVHRHRVPEQETLMDYAMRAYKVSLNNLNEATHWNDEIRRVVIDESIPTETEYEREEGWSHRTTRKNPKITSDARLFTEELFQKGERNSAEKYTAQDAVQAMIAAKSGNKRRFNVEHILTADQITRYFSKLSKLRTSEQLPPPKKPRLTVPSDDEYDSEEDENEEDEEKEEENEGWEEENDEEVIPLPVSLPEPTTLRRSERIGRANRLRFQQNQEIQNIANEAEKNFTLAIPTTPATGM